jgi:hypothetical protein
MMLFMETFLGSSPVTGGLGLCVAGAGERDASCDALAVDASCDVRTVDARGRATKRGGATL